MRKDTLLRPSVRARVVNYRGYLFHKAAVVPVSPEMMEWCLEVVPVSEFLAVDHVRALWDVCVIHQLFAPPSLLAPLPLNGGQLHLERPPLHPPQTHESSHVCL